MGTWIMSTSWSGVHKIKPLCSILSFRDLILCKFSAICSKKTCSKLLAVFHNFGKFHNSIFHSIIAQNGMKRFLSGIFWVKQTYKNLHCSTESKSLKITLIHVRIYKVKIHIHSKQYIKKLEQLILIMIAACMFKPKTGLIKIFSFQKYGFLL